MAIMRNCRPAERSMTILVSSARVHAVKGSRGATAAAAGADEARSVIAMRVGTGAEKKRRRAERRLNCVCARESVNK